jgi:hypothetical protein
MEPSAAPKDKVFYGMANEISPQLELEAQGQVALQRIR